jgi:selenocysteine-specific elongation factor
MGIGLNEARKLADSERIAGELQIFGDLLLAPDAFDRATQLVLARVKNASASLKRSELQSQSGLPAEVLEAGIERLRDTGQIQSHGEAVAVAGKASHLDDKDSSGKQAVSAAYQGAGLAPPSVREIAERLRMPEVEMRRLVTLLIRDKVLIRMGDDDTFLHAGALKDLASRLAPQRGKTLDVSTFKALTGLTRKHAIPLLELLDREHLTRKQGEFRIIL